MPAGGVVWGGRWQKACSSANSVVVMEAVVWWKAVWGGEGGEV